MAGRREVNSKQKGKRGELEWRNVLREAGFTDARRGQQFAGGTDSPDVVCESLSGFHFEVKRVESLNIGNAMAQAIRDASGKKTPTVAHKKNHGEWLVTMRAEDWLAVVRSNSRAVSIISETIQSGMPKGVLDFLNGPKTD